MARLLATRWRNGSATSASSRNGCSMTSPKSNEYSIGGEPSGDAVAVETGLSDPHDGGRTVISVEFSSGLKLIYKPRSLGVESAYFDFVAWINRFDALLPFRILTILDRGDYGWVEYVEHRIMRQ